MREDSSRARRRVIGAVKVLALSIAAALGAAPTAVAGGFAVGTQAGSGTGNAFAGGAAVAEDASVVWTNPAAMTALPAGARLTLAGHLLRPSFRFRDAASSGVFSAPGSGDGGDGGDWAIVPNAFFATDITPALRFGIAFNSPFGLKTDFDPGWRGQLSGLVSQIKTANVQPSLAYRVSDTLSVGGGISIQRLDAKLSNFAGAAGVAQLNAGDSGYGFNVGATFQPSPGTRIGVHYRSAIKFDLRGSAMFSALPVANGGVAASLKVPDSLSISLLHTINPQWGVMGDVTWTGWSSVQQLAVVRTTASAGGSAGSTLTALPFLWNDTWRLGLGANYRLSDRTKLRFGLARDQSPTNDLTRTPRLPDQDRTWLAVGVQYKPWKQGTLEFGYAHEFVKNAKVEASAAPLTCGPHCLNGRFENKADIISIQYSHSF
jgi:long-chain fatty acid transport protein